MCGRLRAAGRAYCPVGSAPLSSGCAMPSCSTSRMAPAAKPSALLSGLPATRTMIVRPRPTDRGQNHLMRAGVTSQRAANQGPKLPRGQPNIETETS